MCYINLHFTYLLTGGQMLNVARCLSPQRQTRQAAAKAKVLVSRPGCLQGLNVKTSQTSRHYLTSWPVYLQSLTGDMQRFFTKLMKK